MGRKVLAVLLAGASVVAACGDDDESDGASASSAAAATTASAAATTAGKPVALAGLDSSFGTNGVLTAALSTAEHDRFSSIAAAPDGRLYAAGFVAKGGDQQMAVARFTAAGALDKSYGTDGVAVVNVAVGGKTVEIARTIAVQSSGKVVVVGPVEHDVAATGDAAKDTDIAVVRLDTNGKPDATFGKDGVARFDIGTGRQVSSTTFVGDTAWGIASLPGDKVAVFGAALASGADRVDPDYVMVGVTASGTLDTAFGTGGYTRVDVNASVDNARAILVQSDGKLVATGYSRDGDGVVSAVLVRTSATGQPDTSFGTGGVATVKHLKSVTESYAVALQDGKYVLAGYGTDASTEKVDLLVYRLTATGQIDTTFGTAGLSRLDLAKEDDRARNVIALPDGRVLATGSGKMTAANVDAMVALFSKDGQPQTDFGKGGYVLTDLGGPADVWYGATVSTDKKYLYVVGNKGTDTASGGNDDAMITRLVIG